MLDKYVNRKELINTAEIRIVCENGKFGTISMKDFIEIIEDRIIKKLTVGYELEEDVN